MLDKTNEEIVLNYYGLIYLFWGLILFLFGGDIQNFLLGLNHIQTTGLIFLTSAVLIFIFLQLFQKKLTIILKLNYFIFLAILIVDLGFMTDLWKFTLKDDIIFLITVGNFYLVLHLTALLLKRIVFIIKVIDSRVQNENEKITLLIGFFGILISLIALIK